ncbi:hypothetical protein [Bacillus marasmi]|uniref:hypothetical protein n=1 Tax=Bacillus marasmi TaxID=1926279 RepID=UPI0011CCBF0A|nr:hypothetical protein [Bacillus marasmi]
MKKINTVKGICEAIWEIEQTHDLLNMRIEEVKIWQYIRMDMYYKIATSIGVLNEPHPIKTSFKNKIISLIMMIVNYIIRNPLTGKYSKDILIFDHPRKILSMGEYIDPYTDYYIKSLDAGSYLVYERPYMGKHLKNNKENIKYLDTLILASQIHRFFNKVKFSEEELSRIDSIQSDISRTFNIDLNLKSFISNRILKFNYENSYYEKLLKKRKPKEIYLVISYNNAPLINAAKTLGIPVTEFQHGIISKYHLGYSYPFREVQQLEYLPDKMFGFSNYWFNKSFIPLDSSQIFIRGYDHFRIQKNKYKKVKKDPAIILFISQGVIGKELFQIAVDLSVIQPEMKVIYKLHPSEYTTWKDSYLQSKELPENLSVVANNNTDLYELMAKASFQIGVFSTAIYEGLEFGCNTILVNLPGIEYMQDLIDDGIVNFANNIDDINSAINTNRKNIMKNTEGSFF